MATNIHQNVLEVSTTPVNGQPWNFNSLLKSILVPRVIAADSSLPPGARLLWAVIRQHSGEAGCCLLSDNALAAALSVSARQCRRYCRALEHAALLRTTQRAGKPPVRELLWDARFAATIRKPPVTSDRGGGQICPGGRTDVSRVYKEEGSLSVVYRSKSAPIEKVEATAAPSSPVRQPPPERTEEEIIRRGREFGFPQHVIERDLERHRARRAKPSAERMVKAAELKPALDSSIPR